ncbi:molybdenum cofactor biosynthesis protein A [Nitzschia inconspicua]|uniref:GTP 3',8-cyclase n=1 Tax=Nitzschia inconspicua TaxID=303405 RepID=A0A9K3LVT9_9STRA|nr:molybdenum cofactor biosynthesis protein A [Nitzschia inconspicua]
MDIEDDDDDEGEAMSSSLLSKPRVVVDRTPPRQQRPRLEALRQQLQKDQAIRPTDFAKNSRNTKSPNDEIEKKSRKEDDKEDKKKRLQELMERLETLPLPEEPLTDTFGRQHSYLRISLSERCNLRCLYCMPEDGVPLQPAENLLSNQEILKLASWFHDQGVNKIRLTGGEPLLRKDLVELVAGLNQLQNLDQIGMTTNGVTLSKLLPDLVDAGMTHINISLDSLDADKFARLTRRPPAYHERVMEAIEDCAKYLPHRTKVNCVVMPDNVDEMEAFAEITSKLPVDIRFIEYMPFNDNLWQPDGFISYKQMKQQLPGLQRIDDGPNDTTKWWQLAAKNNNDQDRTLGRIGFITSMSDHFCGTCNRLRLTADGQLKVCLFGETEVSLRDLMRQEEGGSTDMLKKVIHYAVQRKHFKLGGHKDMIDLKAHSTENRPMILIGG